MWGGVSNPPLFPPAFVVLVYPLKECALYFTNPISKKKRLFFVSVNPPEDGCSLNLCTARYIFIYTRGKYVVEGGRGGDIFLVLFCFVVGKSFCRFEVLTTVVRELLVVLK